MAIMIPKYVEDGTPTLLRPDPSEIAKISDNDKQVASAAIDAARRTVEVSRGDDIVPTTEVSAVVDVTTQVDPARLPENIADIRRRVAEASAQTEKPDTAA